MKQRNLEPDLQGGVVPISKAASSIAALIRRAETTRRPIAITQKGYPVAILLDLATFEALRALARAAVEANVAAPPDGAEAEAEDEG
jgi:prevent-host-death family protein